MGKIVTKEEFKNNIGPDIRKSEKRIALCHGVFDLVHSGHVIHFQQAKAMADVLVVSITASKYVRKGPGRPYFDDNTRLNFLSAIECIDYVMLSEGYTVDDIVETVEPDLYVKGAEYADESADVTGKIREERELVERHGGSMAYTSGDVYSSTKLINNALSGMPEDVHGFMSSFVSRHSMDEILRLTDTISGMKILVVGDLIVDRYTYCEIHGIISKDAVYSSRHTLTEDYSGGSAAIARHIAGFASSVTLACAMGTDEGLKKKIEDSLPANIDFRPFVSTDRETIVKQKFLVNNEKREEYRKVFAIHNIPQIPDYEKSLKEDLKKFIDEHAGNYDAVFVCDFGHGLLDSEMIDLVQQKAKYLVLNCQTNSANKGMNIITKYSRADLFSLDQTELALAYPELRSDEEGALKKLSVHLGGMGCLTRGSAGAYGYSGDKENVVNCPALTLKVKDTIGAGDSFYSLAGLYAAAGAPIEVCTFMGNIGGALGANILGNKYSIEKPNVLKFAGTLMNI